ncbi:MAG: helix-turn-helix transcriptional regulator [Cyclobacteriaceae bacterium]
MNVGSIISSIAFEAHTNESVLISILLCSGALLTTYFGLENLEDTVIGNPLGKLKNEISRLREILKSKNKQLDMANDLIEKQGFLLKKHGISVSNSIGAKIEKFEKLLNSVLLTENDWSDFRKVFDQLHHGFLPVLKMKHPDLTEGEKRLAVLIKLRLSNKEMARMLGISPNSIVKSRYRLKKKLLSSDEVNDQSLEDYIKTI